MKNTLNILAISFIFLVIIILILIPILALRYLGVDLTPLFFFAGYIILAVVLGVIRYKLKDRLLKILIDICLSPVYVLAILLITLYPVLKFLFNYLLSFMISFVIASGFIFLLTNIFQLQMTGELINYLKVTISVFLVILFSKSFKKITNWILTILGKPSGTKNNLIESMDIEREKFVIYAFYLGLLLIINIFKFQKISFLESADYDTTLLQSFVTFIAFDKVQSMYKQLKINPWKVLLTYVNEMSDYIPGQRKGDFETASYENSPTVAEDKTNNHENSN